MPENNRMFEKYPWMSFIVNLEKIQFLTWIDLGQCVSKCVHISRVPLMPDVSKKMHEVYLAKGVQATTAIEGNTLTEEQVLLRMEKKLELPPSKEYLGQEVDNILELCNEIMNKIHNKEEINISIEEICRYNSVILKSIPLADHVSPGELRTCNVGVGPYKAPDHNDVKCLIDKLCQWLNSSYFVIEKNSPILNSIVKAIISHLYIAWIHPFGDGNGRVARILEFAILMSSGIPSPACQLLSNHYNATRSEYYRQLDKASKTRDITDFIQYAIQGFLDGLREQLNNIFDHVLEISWEGYVYSVFKNVKYHESVAKRRRNMILELSRQKAPVPEDKLLSMGPGMLTEYRNKTQKTITRDINELLKLDIIEKVKDGYQAKKSKKMAFMPVKANPLEK